MWITISTKLSCGKVSIPRQRSIRQWLHFISLQRLIFLMDIIISISERVMSRKLSLRIRTDYITGWSCHLDCLIRLALS